MSTTVKAVTNADLVHSQTSAASTRVSASQISKAPLKLVSNDVEVKVETQKQSNLFKLKVEDPLQKREAFAVSLRKKKKQELLQEKRKRTYEAISKRKISAY